MYCKVYPPDPQLRDIIDSILIVKARCLTHFMPREIWLPTVTSILVLNFGTTYKKYRTAHATKCEVISKSHIVGTRDMAEFISMEGYVDLLAIHFKPGGLYTLLQIPMKELNNQIIDADILIKYVTAELEEKVLTAKKTEEKVKIVSQVLLKQLAGKLAVNQTVSQLTGHIISAGSKLDVGAIALSLDMSYKMLERKCSTFIGMTPKRLIDIIRFYHVLKEVKEGVQINWKAIAQKYNYHDQAHLINDFKKYTHMPPNEFMGKKMAFARFITDRVKLLDLSTQDEYNG